MRATRMADGIAVNTKFLPQRRLASAVVLVIALGAGLLVILITQKGVGLSPDGLEYLSAGQRLLRGHGLTLDDYDGHYVALTHFPPGTSLLIAGLGKMGMDLPGAIRWMNAGFLAVTVLLMGWIVYRWTSSPDAAVAGAVMTVTAPAIVELHCGISSEAPFFCVMLGWVACLAEYLASERRRGKWGEASRRRALWFAGSIVCASAGLFLRYPGVVFSAVGALAIVAWAGRPLRARLARATIFAAASVLPVTVYLIYAHFAYGRGSPRVIALHYPSSWHRVMGLATVLSWFVPASGERLEMLVRSKLRASMLAAAMLYLAALWIALRASIDSRRPADSIHAQNSPPAPEILDRPRPAAGLPLRVLTLFIAIYVAAILVSITLFDWVTPLGSRILLPVHLSLILFVAVALPGVLDRRSVHPNANCASSRRGMWEVSGKVAIALIAGFVMLHVFAAGALSARLLRGDARILEYAGRSWTDSALVQRVCKLPAGTRVYSNAPAALKYLAGDGVTSRDLPARFDYNSRIENTEYERQMTSMLDDVRGGAVVVFFNSIDYRNDLPAKDQLTSLLHFAEMDDLADGRIYFIKRKGL